MASRIKHIALSSEDPAKTAAFYKEVFGMTELHRKPGDTGDEGVWLTDGYIYFAILKFKSHEAPDMGEGPSTVPGVHHIGFYVDDLEEACQTIESASATVCPESSQANRKYKGPEGLMIDLRARGWDEQIQAKTQLFELAPVKAEA
jgi:catechol 2,3-dioxygenase-like lactoylglutathione lyase family enzyme